MKKLFLALLLICGVISQGSLAAMEDRPTKRRRIEEPAPQVDGDQPMPNSILEPELYTSDSDEEGEPVGEPQPAPARVDRLRFFQEVDPTPPQAFLNPLLYIRDLRPGGLYHYLDDETLCNFRLAAYGMNAEVITHYNGFRKEPIKVYITPELFFSRRHGLSHLETLPFNKLKPVIHCKNYHYPKRKQYFKRKPHGSILDKNSQLHPCYHKNCKHSYSCEFKSEVQKKLRKNSALQENMAERTITSEDLESPENRVALSQQSWVKTLKYRYINQNSNGGDIIIDLSRLPKLENLTTLCIYTGYVGGNPLLSPQFFASIASKLPNLEHLKIIGYINPNITIPSQTGLEVPTSLKSLTIYGTKLEPHFLDEIFSGNLASLETVTFKECDFLAPIDHTQITAECRIKNLSIKRTNLQPHDFFSFIARIHSLKTANYETWKTQWTDEIIKGIPIHPQLMSQQINPSLTSFRTNTAVTKEALCRLLTMYPNLQRLAIQSLDLSGELPQERPSRHCLKHLSVQTIAAITGRGLTTLAQIIPTLQTLRITDPQFTTMESFNPIATPFNSLQKIQFENKYREKNKQKGHETVQRLLAATPNLQELTLSNVLLSRTRLPIWPDLKVLKLFNANIKAKSFYQLLSSPKLEKAVIENCSVGKGAVALNAENKHMLELKIVATPLPPKFLPEALTQYPSLTHLKLKEHLHSQAKIPRNPLAFYTQEQYVFAEHENLQHLQICVKKVPYLDPINRSLREFLKLLPNLETLQVWDVSGLHPNSYEQGWYPDLKPEPIIHGNIKKLVIKGDRTDEDIIRKIPPLFPQLQTLELRLHQDIRNPTLTLELTELTKTNGGRNHLKVNVLSKHISKAHPYLTPKTVDAYRRAHPLEDDTTPQAPTPMEMFAQAGQPVAPQPPQDRDGDVRMG